MEGKTLELGIKAPFLLQILRGFKNSEYREKKPYYDSLLVLERSVGPKEGAQGWTRCMDGQWRRFAPWRAVRLKCPGIGEAEYAIESVDASAFHYVLRLGKMLSFSEDKEG